MTTKCSITARLTILFLICSSIVAAQEAETYFSVSGVVRDARSKRAIGGVNIYAIGTNIGTVTNEDGGFVIKLLEPLTVSELEISCIGYINTKISISKEMRQDQTFFITSQAIMLDEVEVTSWQNPRDLVELAISKVEQNYSIKPNLLTGFYRETVQKRRNYINISEAVIDIYKTAYIEGVEQDRVQILKGRKLLNQKKTDTLAVKLLGGPNLSVFEIGRAHV